MSPRPFRMARTRALRVVAPSVALLGLLAISRWYIYGHQAVIREREAVTAGQNYLKKGRPDLALRAVSRSSEDGSRGADALTVKGLALALLDQPDEARRPLERSLKLNPNQPMAAKVLAAIYFSRNENGRGFELLRAAAQLDPADFRPWYGAGDIYRRLDRPEKAAQAFEQALRRRPDHHESRVGLIWARLATSAAETVTPLLEGALRDQPDDPEVRSLAARHALELGRTEEAMGHAERCLALNPDHVGALLIRAKMNRNAGHPERALDDAERTVALAPDNLSAIQLLGLIEAALGLKQRSAATFARHRTLSEHLDRIRHFQEKIEGHPDDPEPRWQLGRIAAEAGLTNLASGSFRAALSIDPNCQPARQGLAALEASTNGPNRRTGVPPGPTRLGLTGH